MTAAKQSQLDELKEAACEHAADEDSARCDDKLDKLVKAKPQPEKPE